MSTQNVIHVPDDLLAELRTRAEAQGTTVDEFAVESLRKALDDQAWEYLLEYGAERGRAVGFKEEQAADIVHQWRKEQR